MAATSLVYNGAVTSFANKEIDWGTDTIKCMLVTSGYTVSQTTHRYVSDVSNEIVGTGYIAGGKALTNKTEAFVGQVKRFDADDVVWTNSTITARGAVVYVDTGNSSTSALICFVDFGRDVDTVEGDFTVAWDPTGLFTATVATAA